MKKTSKQNSKQTAIPLSHTVIVERHMKAQSINHHRFKRAMDEKFKEKEAVKSLKYQDIVDSYKKTMKKKGLGKHLKIKGEVMPSFITTNSHCAKSWTRVGYGEKRPLKEGMKHSVIFFIT